MNFRNLGIQLQKPTKLLVFELNFKNMESVLIRAENKSDIALLVSLAKKLGMNTKTLTKTELADWQLGQKIEAGMKTPDISRAEILKALNK